jgi:hypothetical protein
MGVPPNHPKLDPLVLKTMLTWGSHILRTPISQWFLSSTSLEVQVASETPFNAPASPNVAAAGHPRCFFLWDCYWS